MNETPTVYNVKIAQLIVNGQCIDTGTFPAMKCKERDYRGYKTHVGYAPYYSGTCFCKNCADMVVKPYVLSYQGHQYYRCSKCQTINYVN